MLCRIAMNSTRHNCEYPRMRPTGEDWREDGWRYQQKRYDTRYRARRERYRERSRSNQLVDRRTKKHSRRTGRSRSRLRVSDEYYSRRDYSDHPGQVGYCWSALYSLACSTAAHSCVEIIIIFNCAYVLYTQCVAREAT